MTEQSDGQTSSKFIGCLIAPLIPILLLGIAAIVLVINNRPPNIKVPTHGVPKDNGFDYFVRAGEMVGKIRHPGPYSSDRPVESWKLSELESFVKANAPALAVLSQGLTRQYMYPVQRGIHAHFPVYNAMMRKLARTLRGEALYYERRGEYGKAADSLLNGVQLGVTMPRGGMNITGLVGTSVEVIPMKSLPVIVQKLNVQELAHVASRLETIQTMRWPLSEIALEDGRYDISYIVDMLKNSQCRNRIMNPIQWIKPNILDPFGCMDSTPALSKRLGYIWQNACFAFADKSRIVSEMEAYHKAAADEARKHYTGRSSVTVPSEPQSENIFPNFTRAHKYLAIAEARLTLIQTDVALRRYRLTNGRYPDKLEQLIPKYIKSIPIDPFGVGRPLRYKPIDGGKSFLLYSLGPNMKDDGGKPVPGHFDCDTGDMLPNTASSLGL